MRWVLFLLVLVNGSAAAQSRGAASVVTGGTISVHNDDGAVFQLALPVAKETNDVSVDRHLIASNV